VLVLGILVTDLCFYPSGTNVAKTLLMSD